MLPFDKGYDRQYDLALAELTCKGSFEALQLFLSVHQPFIYNIAVRMLYDEQQAKALTEGIVLKLLLNIRQARQCKDVTIWTYRMVAAAIRTTAAPHHPEPAQRNCLPALLLCLPVEQRFVFILAGIFCLSDDTVSSIVEISIDDVQPELSKGIAAISQHLSPAPAASDLLRLYQSLPLLRGNCADRLLGMLCTKPGK